MSDVEKYGLVAVVFVGGLLLVIATQGGFGGDAQALAPEVIDSAAPLRAAAPKAGGENTVRVVSVLPDTPFHWDEPPVPYPGRRSVAAPGSGAGDDAVGALNSPPLSGPKIVTDPALFASHAASSAGRAPGTHSIAKGETLETIAEQYLGSKTRWRELLALNPGLEPKKLKIGQVLRVSAAPSAGTLASSSQPDASVPPPAVTPAPLAKATKSATAAKSTTAATAKTPAPAGRTHTVVKGDTLGAIAKKYLGSTARADDLYKANTDVLKSKDALAVGQVLRIP